MSRTFVYSQVKPKTDKTTRLTADGFKKKFLKNSADVTNVKFDRYESDIGILKKEIECKAHVNADKIVEVFKGGFPENHQFYFNGYWRYLLTAWRNDCGIVVAPYYFWNIILQQLCDIVKKNSKTYQKIFSKSDQKITLAFYDSDFNINNFMKVVSDAMPVDLNTFLPNFSEQPDGYVHAMCGLFADMVQNYYESWILSCEFPTIKVLGTKEEWSKIIVALDNINKLFNANGTPLEYLDQCKKYINDCIANLENSAYWKDMFSVDYCGSGHQEKIVGHLRFLLLNNRGIQLASSLPDMISRYPYINTLDSTTSQRYYVAGLMYGDLDKENILVPQYHYDVTYIDKKLYLLNETDIKIKKELIMFLEMTDQYSDKYDEHHFKYCQGNINTKNIAMTIINAMPSVEETQKAPSQYRWVKDPHAGKYHLFVKAQGNLEKYIDLLNQERLEILKTKHNFWYKGRFGTIPTVYDNCLLEYKTWCERMHDQKDHISFAKKMMPEIYLLEKNRKLSTFFRRYLKSFYNTEIYCAYINEHIKDKQDVAQAIINVSLEIMDVERERADAQVRSKLFNDLMATYIEYRPQVFEKACQMLREEIRNVCTFHNSQMERKEKGDYYNSSYVIDSVFEDKNNSSHNAFCKEVVKCSFFIPLIETMTTIIRDEIAKHKITYNVTDAIMQNLFK